MPVRILIVEDARNAGSLLQTYLHGHLARLAHSPAGNEVPRDAAGHPHALGGQWEHVRPPEWVLHHTNFDVRHVDFDLLPSLVESPRDPEALVTMVREICRTFGWEDGHPDLVIVDLALSSFVEDGPPSETERLRARGGDLYADGCGRIRDASGDLAFDGEIEAPRDELDDPRDELETMTGYLILRGFSGRVPVIVTSYARNPLIAMHCVVSGRAFAVVQRPVQDSSPDTGFDVAAALDNMAIKDLERNAANNESPLDVVIVGYLLNIAGEVFKALSFAGHCLDDRSPRDYLRHRVVGRDRALRAEGY